MSSALLLGVAGAALLCFPDYIVVYSPVRIIVSCCLLTVVGVFVVGFLLLRRATSTPVTSVGLTGLLTFVYYLTSGLEWQTHLEGLSRSFVVFAVVGGFCAVITAAYLDSILERKHQIMIFMSGGLGACIVGVTLDYPEFKILAMEIVLCVSFYAVRKLLEFSRSRTKPLDKTDAVATINEQPAIAGSEYDTAVASLDNPPARQSKHPLIWKGLIVNPETMRNVKIGGKKYTDLLAQGYQPDLINGILVKN